MVPDETARSVLDCASQCEREYQLWEFGWREGFTAGRASRASDYEAGFNDAILAIKAAQHGVVRDIRQHLVTWDGLRTDFGKPRPGDFPGRKAAHDVAPHPA